MKKRNIYILLLAVLISGCSTSSIKIIKSDLRNTNSMFGRVPSRDFYLPVKISDSLKFLWQAEAHGGFTQSSVTYLGDNLFVNDLSGRIFCFDLQTGKVLGQLKHKNPIYTTPVINKYNLIYIETLTGEDNSLVRVFNLIENKPMNEKEIAGRVRTEMLMLGESIFFVTDKGLLYKFSHIGDQYWMVDLKTSVRSSPVSDGSNLYIGTDDGEILEINISDGSVTRRIKAGSIINSGLALYENMLIAGGRDGKVYAFDKTSYSLQWVYNSGSSITAVPVAAKDRIYIVNLGGDIIALDKESGQEIWRTVTDGVLNVTPLLTDNYLIIPDVSNRIIFADIKNGIKKKVINLPNRAKLSPLIRENILIIGFDRGIVRAYEII